MSNKLKHILIIGHEIEINKTEEIKNIYSDEETLIIRDFKKEYSKNTLPHYNKKIDFNTRIDIHAHGLEFDGSHYIEIEESMKLTASYLGSLSSIMPTPLYMHLWSCFGGAANKDLSYLPDGSILITHAESKYIVQVGLNYYSLLEGIKKSKEHINKFQSFLDNIHNESIQTATFNIKLKSKIESFNINLTSSDIKSTATIKSFLDDQALKFSKWYSSLVDKYQHDYPKVFNMKDLKIPEISAEEAEHYLSLSFIYNCAKKSLNLREIFNTKDNDYIFSNYKNHINHNYHPFAPLDKPNQNEHKEIVEAFLHHGLNPNMVGIEGFTPLYSSVVTGHKDISEVLLQHGANPNQSVIYGYTPLLASIHKASLEVLELLLHYNADPDLASNQGFTPLHVAAYKGRIEMVKILLQHGAHLNPGTNDEKTPLYMAAKNGHKQIVELLLQHGANPNLADIHGNIPLIAAINEGYTEITKILLQYNADVNLSNNKGIIPLLASALKSNIEITKLLLKNGANLEEAKKWAIQHNLTSVLGFLDMYSTPFSLGKQDDISETFTDMVGESKLDILHDEI